VSEKRKGKKASRGVFVKAAVDIDEVEAVFRKADLSGILPEQNMLRDVVDEDTNLTEDEREYLLKIGSYANGNHKELRRGRLENLMKKYQKGPGDTGSVPVQVAILHYKVEYMKNVHFKTHRKDIHNRRSFDRLVNRRRKLLLYLKKKDYTTYLMMLKDTEVTEEELLNVGRLEQTNKLGKTRFKAEYFVR